MNDKDEQRVKYIEAVLANLSRENYKMSDADLLDMLTRIEGRLERIEKILLETTEEGQEEESDDESEEPDETSEEEPEPVGNRGRRITTKVKE